MNPNLSELITLLSLEEKAALCSGLDFWRTKPVKRLGIPSILVGDGPHGLRKQSGPADHVGLTGSVPATCFPTASISACSFDRELLREIGRAIGEEALQQDVAIVLGPGVNIKRSPLCGRNFEYFSEDPFVAGELATAMIGGVQSRGVGTSLKHFACNNQETGRMINDSIVDERALREIYLRAFEIAVRKSQPATLMCAYNKVNGTYMCENARILNEIAREAWGFEGAIITDWGAMNERIPAMRAGMDLEMPYAGPDGDREIVAAVRSGELDESILDQAVLRILTLVQKAVALPEATQADTIEAHDSLARRAVAESAVLLKNDGMLPLSEALSIAVIGAAAQNPVFQGGGSSRINAHKVSSFVHALDAEGLAYSCSAGYDLSNREDADALCQEALETAKGKDAVLFFACLLDESEGFDRTDLDLPAGQDALIDRLASVNPNLVVVLHAGSPVRMPWLGSVKAVLQMGLGGQAVGFAALDLLYGRLNPSGKLAESYPLQLADVPASLYFGERERSEYRESIYVGYRYYDKAGKTLLFPFGHGLSYTQFAYTDLELSPARLGEGESLKLSFTLTNTGERRGKEIVQIYFSAPPSKIFKPVKELCEFAKLDLAPGESQRLSFSIAARAFAFWNSFVGTWQVESGIYKLLVGSSSTDIRLMGELEIRSDTPAMAVPDYRQTAPLYYDLPDGSFAVPDAQFEAIYGGPIRRPATEPQKVITQNSTLWDARDTFIGKQLIKLFNRRMKKMTGGEETQTDGTQKMMASMVWEMPLRSFGMSGMKKMTIAGLVDLLNKKYLAGFKKIIASLRK